MRFVRFNYDNDLAILKERCEAAQTNIMTLKEQIKLKNDQLSKLKDKLSNDKK